MIFKRSKKEGRIRVKIFVNYGDSRIEKTDISVHPASSVLDALKMVSNVEYTPDESATGHMGSMITAIDGFKNDRTHFWLYYIRDEDDCGWRLPMKTPDAVSIDRNTMIAWRYHEVAQGSLGRSENQMFGPLYSRECLLRIKRCNRQF